MKKVKNLRPEYLKLFNCERFHKVTLAVCNYCSWREQCKEYVEQYKAYLARERIRA